MSWQWRLRTASIIPYDKAKAIEGYLRTNYPYDLAIPAPPADQDVTDYFLFELKRGYCDYYATAMVVLARASGLPARFVSGYSTGSYDALKAEYVVKQMNAHSWAEIYFPEFGWIEFAPTASQPEIERTEKQPEIPAVNLPATETQKFANFTYSSGERAGYVQKFAKKGWLCKTWEGELAMANMPGALPEVFAFSLHDDALAAEVNKQMGSRVTLRYEQHLGLPSCFGDTSYWVTAVRPVTQP